MESCTLKKIGIKHQPCQKSHTTLARYGITLLFQSLMAQPAQEFDFRLCYQSCIALYDLSASESGLALTCMRTMSDTDQQLNQYDSLQTLAEKAAWDLSKKHGFQLVTINPVFVFGPVLSSRADATSVLMMKVRIRLISSTHQS